MNPDPPPADLAAAGVIAVLSTGARVPAVCVTHVLCSLEEMVAEGLTGALALYDLLQLCRDPRHVPPPASVESWARHQLLDDGNRALSGRLIHSTTRDIVLAAVTGDDMALRVDPGIVVAREPYTPGP